MESFTKSDHSYDESKKGKGVICWPTDGAPQRCPVRARRGLDVVMINIEESVTIARPVERVFTFATDFQNNTRWQTNVILTEQTSEGPMGEGTTYRLVNRFMGKHFDSNGVISEYIPNQICSYRFVSGPVGGSSSFIFEPVNEGTRFITKGAIELIYFKSMGILARHKARRQVRNDLQTLKRILENGEG